MTPVRVAVVDDSVFIRKAIVRMLAEEPQIEIVGTAASGEELLERLDEWRPDVVTLDLAMPGMGGLQTLDRLMARRPLPVIVLSGQSRADAPAAIEALHRGALEFIDKQSYSLVDFEALRGALRRAILGVSGPATEAAPPVAAPLPPPAAPPTARAGAYRLVLIGASTGGPVSIQRLLEDLGASCPVPVVIVQHMPEGFTAAFAARLNAHLPLPVREAADGELLLPATVYLAPAGRHLLLDGGPGRLRARLSRSPEGLPHRPSIDLLFTSTRQAVGGRVLAALLTGMGRDGAAGLAALRSAGAFTLAQDEASSVVWGMPRAALELGAVREVLPIERLGGRLRKLLAPDGGPTDQPPDGRGGMSGSGSTPSPSASRV